MFKRIIQLPQLTSNFKAKMDASLRWHDNDVGFRWHDNAVGFHWHDNAVGFHWHDNAVGVNTFKRNK